MRREKVLLHHIQSGIPVFPDRLQPGIPYGSDHLLRCALVGNLKLLRRLAIPFPAIGKIHPVAPHRQMGGSRSPPV